MYKDIVNICLRQYNTKWRTQPHRSYNECSPVVSSQIMSNWYLLLLSKTFSMSESGWHGLRIMCPSREPYLSTIKIHLSELAYLASTMRASSIIIISLNCNLFSTWYSVNLALSNNHSLTQRLIINMYFENNCFTNCSVSWSHIIYGTKTVTYL